MRSLLRRGRSAPAATEPRPTSLEEARAALAAFGGKPRGAVRLRIEGSAAQVVLAHPEARGALSLSMMVELAEVVAKLQTFEGGLVVISSPDPRAFCSGGYLPELVAVLDAPEKAEAMSRAMSAVLDGLRTAPALVVAALDGLALGGGAELALAADLRVGGDGAKLHFVQARLGIAPGWGGAARLVERVGRGAALALLAGADPIDADRAFWLGLLDQRVTGDAARGALAWLDRPTEVLRALKRQVDDPEAEPAAFAGLWGKDAHVAALARAEPGRKR